MQTRQQEAPRLFINNIIVRFHRSLELEEDEIKTIICRYPPPEAPPPPSVVSPILEPVAPVPIIVPAKLSEIELLLIICALLFLTLLLLGIGISYYCLKRRNIKIIRKKKLPSPAPSEITKISSVFDQIRIPRAVAMTSSIDSSTEYPSSDSEERRTIVSETSTFRNDHFKYENTAFIPEPYPVDGEKEDSIVTNVPLTVAHKPIITSGNFTETLVSNEFITTEDVVNESHRKVTSCLYKKLPTTPHPPSIPDNDCWSQAETIDNLPLVPYVPHISLPRINVKNVSDTFLTNEVDTVETEITKKHKNIVKSMPAPKITSVNYTETLVQSEDIVDESLLDETHKKVTTCLYKRLTPVDPPRAPSIPDNDCWSQAETDVDEIQTKSFTGKLPVVTVVSKDDLYVSNQVDTMVTEESTSGRRVMSSHLAGPEPSYGRPYTEANVTSLDITSHEFYHQSSDHQSGNFMYQREREDFEVDAMTTRQHKPRSPSSSTSYLPLPAPVTLPQASDNLHPSTSDTSPVPSRLLRQPTYVIDSTANYNVISQSDINSTLNQQASYEASYYSSSNYPPHSHHQYTDSPGDGQPPFDHLSIEQPFNTEYYAPYDQSSRPYDEQYSRSASHAYHRQAASSYQEAAYRRSSQGAQEYTVIEKIGGRPSSGQSVAYFLDFDPGMRPERDNDVDELTTRSWKIDTGRHKSSKSKGERTSRRSTSTGSASGQRHHTRHASHQQVSSHSYHSSSHHKHSK